MRTLIVEDDQLSQRFLQKTLGELGECVVVENGVQALEAFTAGLENTDPFDLVCLDIMMPEMDGQEALTRIRDLEKKRGIHPRDEAKVIMTTALSDPRNVVEAYYKGGATAYLAKPIDKAVLLDTVRDLGLMD